MARITTIIPTYRRPRLLRRALGSVLAQGDGDFEVRVYDNASGDATADVVREFAGRDGRVHYFCHRENIGAARNFEFALGRVETAYFNFLSDDDLLLPGFFATALALFAAHPDAMSFIGNPILADERARVMAAPLANWRSGRYDPPEAFLRLAKFHRWPVWTASIFRTDLLRTIGPLDREIGAPNDVDFQLRALARHPAVASNRPCAIFVAHCESATTRDWFPAFLAGTPRLLASVTRAIHQAERDAAIGAGAASAMRRALRSGLIDLLSNNALSFARRGRFEVALAAAPLLADVLGRPGLAMAVRMMARGSAAGAMVRAALQMRRKLRRRARRIRSRGADSKLDQRYAAMVRAAVELA